MSRPIIGTVARLISSKGIDILLQAFAEVCKTHPSASLIIVGDGPERDSLQEMASQLQIAQNTYFLGMRNDVSAIMSQSDLYRLPNIWGGIWNSAA